MVHFISEASPETMGSEHQQFKKLAPVVINLNDDDDDDDVQDSDPQNHSSVVHLNPRLLKAKQEEILQIFKMQKTQAQQLGYEFEDDIFGIENNESMVENDHAHDNNQECVGQVESIYPKKEKQQDTPTPMNIDYNTDSYYSNMGNDAVSASNYNTDSHYSNINNGTVTPSNLITVQTNSYSQDSENNSSSNYQHYINTMEEAACAPKIYNSHENPNVVGNQYNEDYYTQYTGTYDNTQTGYDQDFQKHAYDDCIQEKYNAKYNTETGADLVDSYENNFSGNYTASQLTNEDEYGNKHENYYFISAYGNTSQYIGQDVNYTDNYDYVHNATQEFQAMEYGENIGQNPLLENRKPKHTPITMHDRESKRSKKHSKMSNEEVGDKENVPKKSSFLSNFKIKTLAEIRREKKLKNKNGC